MTDGASNMALLRCTLNGKVKKKLKMRIVVFAMLIIIFNLAGCNKISQEKKLAIATWEKVANKEFSNWDFWAGTGLYFYEEDSEKYCVWMIYGSGVPVAYHYESKAVITEGIISISLPIDIDSGALKEGIGNKKVSEIKLVIEVDAVMMGDTKYIQSEGLNFFDKMLKK